MIIVEKVEVMLSKTGKVRQQHSKDAVEK